METEKRDITLSSVIRCPHCGFQAAEWMPVHACCYFYTCTNCRQRLQPKPGDCCVFCSYGSQPCPPVQDNKACCPGDDSTTETLIHSSKKQSNMTYTFKTNIKCGGCIATVTPYLNSNNEIKHWEVDTQHPEKILTVETEKLTGEMIEEIIKKAGYTATTLS